ncbi:MAG TPA: hypothetical protein VGG06_22485 [Thermoanaerobaculia bacterium]|jgi:hypothetical protein
MKRTLWEAVAVLLFAAAGYGLWQWSEINAQRAVGEQETRHQQEVAAVKEGYSAWIRNLTEEQAKEVFQAFAAGIHPAVLAGRSEALLEAKTQVLHIPEIVFVHVLAPDGQVILSSDEKLSTVGRADDERARWALAAQELGTREGERPGTLEVAAPVLGSAGPAAVLWIGYHVERALEETRPPGLAPAADASAAL